MVHMKKTFKIKTMVLIMIVIIYFNIYPCKSMFLVSAFSVIKLQDFLTSGSALITRFSHWARR